MIRRAVIVFALGFCAARGADRIELAWPTPSTAWTEGKALSSLLQHAGSGDPESGGFGGVRSGGAQFHEGIDIRATARDNRGEPKDEVFAAMAGIVRHVNPNAGDSSYGRYLVLEHPEQPVPVYTLYAHLARIGTGIRAGVRVNAGQAIAVMGHSSGGYMIPKERAHLHFEIGVAMTRDFQAWYDRARYGNRNEHGMWNGMNLVGFDPLALFNEARTGRVTNLQEYFQRMQPVARVRLATYRVPDFVTRYPALLTKPMPLGPVAGWEITFNWTGLPFAWTPLTSTEIAGLTPNQPRLIEVNGEVEKRQRSKSLAVSRGGAWTVGKDLETALELLFGGGLKM